MGKKITVAFIGCGFFSLTTVSPATTTSLFGPIIMGSASNNIWETEQTESVLEDGEQEDIFSPEYFEKLSDAFGIRYCRIETKAEADKYIPIVLDGEEACVCEVFVDEKQFFEPKSSSKVLPDGRIVSPSLDDMSPFLDRAEFESIRFEGE